MRAAKVIGRIVATRRVVGLEQERLLLLVPVDAADNITGGPFVACDAVQAGPGSRVIWIGGREAALGLSKPGLPVDATCIAILEKHTI